MEGDYVIQPVFNIRADRTACPGKPYVCSCVYPHPKLGRGVYPDQRFVSQTPYLPLAPLTPTHAPSTIMLGNIQQVNPGNISKRIRC